MTAFPEGAQERVWRSFAAEMAEAPLMIRRMIKEHCADADGRCDSTRCTAGGMGYGVRWPCTLYAVAIEAKRLLEAQKAERVAEPEAATRKAKPKVVRQPASPCTPRHLAVVDNLPGGAAAAAGSPLHVAADEVDELPSGAQLVAEVLALDALDIEIRAFFEVQGAHGTGSSS